MADPVPSLDELVEVACKAEWESFCHRLPPWDEFPESRREGIRRRMRAILSAVLPRVVGAADKALTEAIDGWSDGSQYKGAYLLEKHGDAEGIASATAVRDQLRALGGG